MAVEFEAFAKEAARIRDGLPVSPRTGGKKVVYPKEFISRVGVAARHWNGQLSEIAKQLGISPSALRNWRDSTSGAPTFVPLRPDASPGPGKSGNLSVSGAPSRWGTEQSDRGLAAVNAVTLVVRETRVELPAGTQPSEFAGLVAALRGGLSC